MSAGANKSSGVLRNQSTSGAYTFGPTPDTDHRPVSRLAPRPASDLIVSINNPSLVIISITHSLSNCDNASLGDPPMLINGFGFKPSSIQLQ